jgi:SAM-dependent methyltransferase
LNAPVNLTTKRFWDEDHHGNVVLPARPDLHFSFERCLASTLEEVAPIQPGQRVLEVGCAPGRWLVWHAERFGARVTGIEYSAYGAALSRENLSATGVDGEIHEADFFDEHLELGSFDLVLSLGFIEHFDDLPATFARHAAFVAPGGRLVIGLPNFRGLIGFAQYWADADYLRLHNRRAMEPGVYTELADSAGMTLDVVRYVDGADPAMIRVTRRSAHLLVLPLTAWRKTRVSERVNGRLVSSYLVLAFTRPLD